MSRGCEESPDINLNVMDKIWHIKCGEKTGVCEELRKRRVGANCIQEVRWKGQEACFVGTSGQRSKLWWSGNEAEFVGVGILGIEEISGNVVKVGRKSERVMAIVLSLGIEVIRIICGYGPQNRRPDTGISSFF